MKILVVHNQYQQHGGEDISTRLEVELLRRRGIQVVEYRDHNDRIKGMNPIELAVNTVWSRSSYRNLTELVRRERPDVAHFHNTFPLISPSAFYACKANGVPTVLSLRNYRLLCLNATFVRNGRLCLECLGRGLPWPGVLRSCYRGSFPATFVAATSLTVHRYLRTWERKVDCFVALTRFAQSMFISEGFPACKVKVKPNHVDPDPGPGEHQGGFALFVGRLSVEKGIETLMETWDRLNGSLPLKIVGTGPLADKVKTWAGTRRDVEYLGFKPLGETWGLMRDAFVLVLTSIWYETFGRVAIEAFATGLPVIASRLGCMAEVVDDMRTGLHFNPGDPDDLAGKIIWALKHPSEMRRMGEVARNEYLTKYTAETNFRLLMNIYQTVSGSARS